MSLEDQLKTERLGQKRSVEDVASAVSVHPNTIRYAENGRSKIALPTFQAWAHELGYEVVLLRKNLQEPIPAPAQAQAEEVPA